MELPFTTPAQVAAAYCVPWNPNDPLIPLYTQAAAQFNTDQDASLAAIIMVALQNQMMLYRKSSCTDCATAGLPPTQTVINPPASIQSTVPQGIVQTNNTDALISEGVAFGTQGAEIGAKIAGAASIIPVISAFASVVQDIIGIFGAAHAQAVAEEQAVNCGVAQAFNKWIPQYDAAVANGSMTAEAALSAITQIIQTQLEPALDPVISSHNWGWGANQVLQAHLWFRQQWYPSLETSLSSVAGLLTGGTLTSLTQSPIILVAIGLGIVLLTLGTERAKT